MTKAEEDSMITKEIESLNGRLGEEPMAKAKEVKVKVRAKVRAKEKEKAQEKAQQKARAKAKAKMRLEGMYLKETPPGMMTGLRAPGHMTFRTLLT